MDNNFDPNKTIKDVAKNFEVVGARRAKNWYIYALVRKAEGNMVKILRSNMLTGKPQRATIKWLFLLQNKPEK